MLTIYRRHKKDCEHRREGRKYRRCRCPIWVDGHLNGEEIRQSLDTCDWQKAQETIRKWEADGQIVKESEIEPLTFKAAADKFILDCRARGLREPTIYKYLLLFRQFQAFAEQEGRRFLKESDLDWLRRFRASWPNQNVSACKKLECLKAFFRFAYESDWISENPAAKLKPPKVVERQIMSFSKQEVALILATCNEYPDRMNAARLRAMVLLLRYSGLRIRDVVMLKRERISGDKLLLYTAKTGTLVWCPLPPTVLAALDAIPPNGNYFFWTGYSKPKSAVGNWQRALRRLFVLAGVPTGHAHRFRHAFAVELLQAGVPVERVAAMLGHRSVKVTERYYSAWNLSRQNNLRLTCDGHGSKPQSRRRVRYRYTRKPATLTETKRNR
jgi:integrase/recombinase XerD